MTRNPLPFIPKKDSLFILSASTLRKKLIQREFSCVSLTQAFLERINTLNPQLNAYCYVCHQDALKQARDIDAHIKKGECDKALLGVPMALSDTFALKGSPRTLGSVALKGSISKEDCLEVQRLKQAGAVILGKTQVSEFCLDPEGENHSMPRCKNPYRENSPILGEEYGAACALASGLASLVLSSDGCGSARLSASQCGLFALKPTRGLIPLVRSHHLAANTHKYFTAAPLAKTAKDCATLLQTLAHPLKHTHISHLHFPANYTTSLKTNFQPLNLAIIENFSGFYCGECSKDSFSTLTHSLKNNLNRVDHLDIPFSLEAPKHFSSIYSVDHSLPILSFFKDQREIFKNFNPLTQKWIQLGKNTTGIQYSLASTYQRALKEKMNEILTKYDLIALPAFCSHLSKKQDDFFAKDLEQLVGKWAYLFPFNMTGHPSCVVPLWGEDNKYPQAIQLITNFYKDEILLQMAYLISSLFPHKNK